MWKSLSGSCARILLAITLVALLMQGASAHTYLSTVVLGGTPLAEGDCVRPHPSTAFDSPIPLVTDADMTCGWLPYAQYSANRACPIKAGDSMSVVWHHNSNAADDNIMDVTHKGPILYYLAKSGDGSGAVWFKIYEDGYDASTNTWATDKMIANRGMTSFRIPADIAPGNYLLRGEIFALHNGYVLDGVQPYVGCVELTITGSGSANPAGVAFPGYYKNTDPGFNVNLYQPIVTPYIIPGPALYTGASSSGSSNPSSGSNTGSSNPTSAPSNPTSPPSNPTSAPSTPSPSSSGSSATGGNLKVAMNSGSNTWWLGVELSGGSEQTTTVEIKDSKDVSSWTSTDRTVYDGGHVTWVFSRSIELTLPISVRLTSASNKKVTYINIFTAWGQTTPSGSTDYSSSNNNTPTQAPYTPTQAPYTPTQAPYTPTQAPYTPTQAPYTPTQAPYTPTTPANNNNNNNNGASIAGTIYDRSSEWWFAITLNSRDSSTTVSIKDSGSHSDYVPLAYADWGYSISAQGIAFVTPLTLKITRGSSTVYAQISTITPGATVTAQ